MNSKDKKGTPKENLKKKKEKEKDKEKGNDKNKEKSQHRLNNGNSKKEKNKGKKLFNKSMSFHIKSGGPPDISNHNAIIKIFKSEEAYEAFRNRYLYINDKYVPENEDRSIEIMRHRCKNKKKKQENMYQQALKNKDSLLHNEKLYKSIFRERDYYNDYSKEKLDYKAAEKLLRDSSEKSEKTSSLNDDEDDIMKYVNENDTNLTDDIYKGIKNEKLQKAVIKEEEEEEKEKEKEEIKEDENLSEKNEENIEESFPVEKIEIAENIDSNMIEKNSSYKSFSFNDAVLSNSSNINNKSSQISTQSRSSKVPSTGTSSKSTFITSQVPLCMDDLIHSDTLKLPVIEPRYKKNWQALDINEVYEHRSIYNPYSNEPKSKIIIPGIDKQYQRFIPSKNGNNFWKICDGNIYENLY